ncbi:hypothetical protein C923_03532 [Plasmodium falciparum UGT5.1]|uniref:FHA domain-containing protein, putative n=4 Tax=Plasmodium falciparum TaxID=5833 RepID=Q8II28_PLAF7|nr:FHA domain-containing protein, putative [Plasmodium falciparum 3D7]EWC75823.1 hypothetical protein C923_03532 [Plasmodium falciparum UGT5.1]KAF4330884.1 FHA domain-containing protein [Plasmodium falciparum NF54]KNG77428.1 hypothetical protein PFMG_03171 [Plasmodium falciparum IGH-CR14]PKC49053.1 FHA domain-containing protein [Plasmodium falciparum NF54]CZT98999.1 FHA domain-containing protein, putative [Plasmodium falciparum 3D7]|eukprot:XP_001348018.1 conserved Plasmodium protein, unknown function [Plasmodium falciparum 3D7]
MIEAPANIQLHGNEYKEECIYSSIDNFNGPFDYLNYYFLCEIVFDDFSFKSPYHCYFFLRNQFENFKNVHTNYVQNSNSDKPHGDHIKIINQKNATELFQNEEIIYYDEIDTSDVKRKALENINNIINRLTISDLMEISLYFSENPEWENNKLAWMEMIQRDKFRKYDKMRENLKETGMREIIFKMNNDEIDRMKNKSMIKDFLFFGVIDKKGQNYLGRIYMIIRNDIIKNYEIYTWLLTNCNMQTDENLAADIFIEETYYEKKPINNKGSDDKKKKENSNKGGGNHKNDDHLVFEKKMNNYTFEKKEYICFGKNETNDIVCMNPSISRFHCVLYMCEDFQVYLIDVGSKSGTKLNNCICEIHKKYKVSNNDVISLGVSKTTFKININVEKVLEYLDKRECEIKRKMEIMNEEINYPLGNKLFFRLKISNIYYKCNEYDILDFFKDCGQIKKIQLYNMPLKKHINQNIKNIKAYKEAIIDVFDEQTSANILNRNECFLYGRKIYIVYVPIKNDVKHDNNKSTYENVAERYDTELTTKDTNNSIESIILTKGKGADKRSKYQKSKKYNDEKLKEEKHRGKKDKHKKHKDEKYKDEKYKDEKYKDEKYKDEKYKDEKYKDEKYKDEKYKDEKYKDEKYRDKKYKEDKYKDDKYKSDKYKNDKYKDEKYRDKKYKEDKYKDDKYKDDKHKDDKYKDEKYRLKKHKEKKHRELRSSRRKSNSSKLYKRGSDISSIFSSDEERSDNRDERRNQKRHTRRSDNIKSSENRRSKRGERYSNRRSSTHRKSTDEEYDEEIESSYRTDDVTSESDESRIEKRREHRSESKYGRRSIRKSERSSEKSSKRGYDNKSNDKIHEKNSERSNESRYERIDSKRSGRSIRKSEKGSEKNSEKSSKKSSDKKSERRSGRKSESKSENRRESTRRESRRSRRYSRKSDTESDDDNNSEYSNIRDIEKYKKDKRKKYPTSCSVSNSYSESNRSYETDLKKERKAKKHVGSKRNS